MFKNAAKLAAKVGTTNCLQLEVGPRDECLCPPNWIRPLSIVPGAVARDPRVQAHVSYDEAVTYVQGVNARIANHRSCWYKPFLACFVIGAAVFGGMMGAFHEEPRIRCKGRVCERGEDPLVAGCCMFWCCGQEMKADKVRGRRLRGGSRGGGGSKGGKKKNNVESSRGHKLKTRPYDRWDVWANETYFDDTERCTPYEHDYTVEKKGKLDEKRDAAWACDTCPAFLLGTGMKCRTMVEGKARRHETAWPLFLLIPFLLPLVLYFTVACTTLTCQAQLLYKKAFEEWRARGVITHVEFQRGGKHSPHYLRLWFPPGQAVQTVQQTANPEFEHWFPEHCRPGWSAHQNIDMCEQGDVIHNWREKHSLDELMRKVEQNGYSAVCVGNFEPAFLKKFPYQLTAGHCKPSSGYTNTLYIWSGGGSGKAVPAVEETGTVVEAGGAPPPLHDIVDALKRNLGLDGTWPEVVDAACLQLGVAPTGSLQEKGDACWRAMEG